MPFEDLSDLEHVFELFDEDLKAPDTCPLDWCVPTYKLRTEISKLAALISEQEEKNNVPLGASYQAELLAETDYVLSLCQTSGQLRQALVQLKELLLKCYAIKLEHELNRIPQQIGRPSEVEKHVAIILASEWFAQNGYKKGVADEKICALFGYGDAREVRRIRNDKEFRKKYFGIPDSSFFAHIVSDTKGFCVHMKNKDMKKTAETLALNGRGWGWKYGDIKAENGLIKVTGLVNHAGNK